MKPEDLPPGSYAAWSYCEDLPSEEAAQEIRYQAGGELGRGGMGVVSAATDGWLDREVAVKRPRPDASEEVSSRMMREARITARLVHPSIVPIYDVGEDEEGPYYTMPVLVGTSLMERLGTVELAAHIRTLAEASRAVGYAHTHGIVHRDIKPANLLLGQHGEVWVLDWGVAYDVRVPDLSVVGTPGFQAPEQRLGEQATPAADVYSMGKLIDLVLRSETAEHPELRAIATRCLQHEASRRYVDGSALAADLERWLEGRRVEAHAYSAAEVLRRFVARHRAALLVALLAVVIGLLLGAVALQNQQAERRRGDAALAASLSQQAVTLFHRDARAEAEVLAAHSLRMSENPVARGVLMSWADTAPIAFRGVLAQPCARPFLEEDGRSICVEKGLSVYDARGALQWSADVGDASWEDGVRTARLFGDSVLLRRSSNSIELWSAAGRVAMVSEGHGHKGIADGLVPLVHADRRIGLVDLVTGETEWTEQLCAQVAQVFGHGGTVVVGCRGPSAYVGSLEGLGEPIALPGSPSSISWSNGPVIGTFEGQLVSLGAEPVAVVESGIGSPIQLLDVGHERFLVVGERGRSRLWSAASGAFLGSLPDGVGRVAWVEGELRVKRHRLERYALPDQIEPSVYDRVDGGGVSYLQLSPSGRQLLGGQATGEVTLWDVDTGKARIIREANADGVAKGGAFHTDHAVLFNRQTVGVEKLDLRTGERSTEVRAFGRAAASFDGGVAWSSYVDALLLLEDDGERHVKLPAPVAAIEGGADLWFSDRYGAVYKLVDGEPEVQFTVEGGIRGLGVFEDLLVSTAGEEVVARSLTGEERWRWTAAMGVTSVDVDRDWIAVGDLGGRVTVLRHDGSVVASLEAHERLVSEVVLRDGSLYSASWDGRVRRWGLGGIEVPAADLVANAESTWGLSLEDALGQ